jgi:hypothetical protein
LCGVFPFFLMVLKMQYKPHDKKHSPPAS